MCTRACKRGIVRRIFVHSCLRSSIWLLLAASTAVHAQIKLTDDAGISIEMHKPARRIVSLAPHATELLYAAGAGDYIVGVVDYSDYPPQARQIEHVGSYNAFDLEKIVALQPDLIIAWRSGNPGAGIERLRRLGFKVFISEPRELDQIAANIDKLGWLARTEDVAQLASYSFRDTLARLQRQYSQRRKVSVFYQVAYQPLYTLNGEHVISKVIDLCGGENIFASLGALAPQVSLESVVQADPEVIVGTHYGEGEPDWLQHWQRWSGLRAVAAANVYYLHPDIISRPTPRLLLGAQKICEFLDKARTKK